MLSNRKIFTEENLLRENIINQKQLDKALEYQKKNGGLLSKALIDLGIVEESKLLVFAANQLGIPYIDLANYSLKPNIIKKLPENVARRFKVLVLDAIGSQYLVGFSNPTDVVAFDEISRILNARILKAVVKAADLNIVIEQIYRRSKDITNYAKELHMEIKETQAESNTQIKDHVIDDKAPVAKMIESIFADAAQVGASDIHIEPDKDSLRIRQRVDGVLQEHIIPSKQISDALILRLKLMSNLNIAEKRIPQDGRFNINVGKKNLDIRLSTIPTKFGESVVMRLLDQSKQILSLDKIVPSKMILNKIRHFITRPNGIILLTGPTGSGKSTTLYAILNELNDETKKIITIEDPIEYTLPRINQVQVNPKIELTFARVLRSALRQDPEIIMIGEMRDEETMEIGLRAALTGHLVFSTLHTNDAISSALRLIDMGAATYLLASALRLIVAQRLVRKLCPDCASDYSPNEEEIELLKLITGQEEIKGNFKKPTGCYKCNNVGYSGRFGIHEILEVDSQLASALRTGDANKFSEAAKKQETFKLLSQVALEHAMVGETSLDEVFKQSLM